MQIIKKGITARMLQLIIYDGIYRAFYMVGGRRYILKSPMRRIHKIKTKTVVKSVITDEGIEQLRDHCTQIRDLAMIDLLYSTGIRVGDW